MDDEARVLKEDQGGLVKRILIADIYTEKRDDNIRLNYVFEIEGNSEKRENVLYFELNKEFGKYICKDRCDCAVVAIMAHAIKNKFDTIETNIPISKKLLYNLTYHVIPQLSIVDGGYTKLKIIAPVTSKRYYGRAVGAGMSRGVDSFATMYEYGKGLIDDRAEFKDYKITHFVYNNIGAHHGRDAILGESKYSSEQLYKGQLNKTREFCEKYGYNLIVTNSNLNEFLAETFGASPFYATHTYRNISIPLLLQKLYRRFYYSSAYTLGFFHVSLKDDCAKYEKWLLSYIGTENIEFFSSNQEWSRLEKARLISEMDESYDYLCVCLVGIDNCGLCSKCKKTLMELDVLGVLDKYYKSFDLEKYLSNYREQWFEEIYDLMDQGGVYGYDYKEIYEYGIRHDFPYIKEPSIVPYLEPRVGSVKSQTYRVRSLPARVSNMIYMAHEGEMFFCIGEHGNWIKVKNDEIEGYIYKTWLNFSETVKKRTY